jgi:phosphoglycolate phosphatase
MRYSCLLFDLDGTLIYSHPGIFYGLEIALKEQDMVELNVQKLRKCIGPPLHVSFTEIWELNEKQIEQAVRTYRKAYDEIGWEKCSLIDGAKETLTLLKELGYTLALATSKPLPFARRILEKFGLSPLFSVVVGSGFDGSFPDKKSVIEECVRRLGVQKHTCLMIGDRKHDLQGANAAQVDCAIVDVGYSEKGEFEQEKPKYLFSSYEALQAFFVRK